MSGASNFITDKLKAKPRGDLARAAVAAYGDATWSLESQRGGATSAP